MYIEQDTSRKGFSFKQEFKHGVQEVPDCHSFSSRSSERPRHIQNESLRPAFNPQIKRETPVDTEGETNPAWNSTIRFTIGNQAVEYQGVVFVIKLYCSRTLGDRYIGEVSLSFKDLFDGAAPTSQGRSSGIVSYPVKRGGADSQGNLAAAGIFIVKVVLEATLGASIDLDIPFFGEDVPIHIELKS
ncbi:hypothetical protein CK203_019400 [Vitis vinifera]|uniref:C2 domain-containing protein n=1 Tax=Vitis vinifera TaxID=29760 RepID=A0A438IYN4_VITVI|nr:hypothetical protein CK203_019400 [Vitis vinifera]